MLAAGYMPISSAFNPEQLFWKMRYADRMRFYSGLYKNMKNKKRGKKAKQQTSPLKPTFSMLVCLCGGGRGMMERGEGLGGWLILKMVITYLIACIMDH